MELAVSSDAAGIVNRANQKLSNTATRRFGPTMMSILMENPLKGDLLMQWWLIKSKYRYTLFVNEIFRMNGGPDSGPTHSWTDLLVETDSVEILPTTTSRPIEITL